MGWIGCIRCEKFIHDFVDFCIICTNSAHFAPSFMQQRNGPKCTQTLRNTTKDEFGVQWGWIGCVHCENIWRDFVASTFAFIAPVQPILHRVSCTNKMVQNAPKHYETHQNMSLRSDGVDRVDLLQKILTQLCGLNFCINYNSSARVEPSIVKQRNIPKCPQTLRNKTKHEFRAQWGGSGAFVVKNSDTTSWDELLHYLHQFSPFCTEFHALTKWSKVLPNSMKRTKTCV